MSVIVNKASLIEHGELKFLIMDAPKDSNLHLYIKECKKHNVVSIARISESTYSREEVEKAGISLHEFFFHDGASPPPEIITLWIELITATFNKNKSATAKGDKPCIAVHCVAGLGRAPVLVAIALIEYGLDAVSAVTYIRERRRGAINAVQLAYLQSYVPRRSSKKCAIM